MIMKKITMEMKVRVKVKMRKTHKIFMIMILLGTLSIYKMKMQTFNQKMNKRSTSSKSIKFQITELKVLLLTRC
jgi:hypothetical protein